MKGVLDHYIVELDCLFENSLLVGGGLLASQDFEKSLSVDGGEMIYNPNKYRKTSAKIVASPSGFSDRGKNLGCSKIFRPGDTLHFYWSAINEDRRISSERLYGQADGRGGIKMRYTYRIPAWCAVCASRDGHIEMNDGYLLAVPIMQSEDEIRTKSGIYLQESVKPRPLSGTVAKSNGFHTGRGIYYLPNSDLELTVDGSTYYAMKESDVFALIGEEGPVPIGDAIMMEPGVPEDVTSGGIHIPDRFKKYPPTGTVLSTGPDCDVAVGEKIWFEGAPTEMEINGVTYISVREGQVLLRQMAA